jgi:hypothetical protein
MKTIGISKWHGCAALVLAIGGRIVTESFWRSDHLRTPLATEGLVVFCWLIPAVALGVSGLLRGNTVSRLCGACALFAALQFIIAPLLESGRRY